MMSDETTSATEPSPADLQRLQQLWHGFRVSQALYVAASLGLADLLADGPKSADALAATTGANADALYRVLRALASIGVFAETAERHFTLTPMARLLQKTTRIRCARRSSTLATNPTGHGDNLLPSVMSGANAYEAVFGAPHFQYLAQHPEPNADFNQAMSASSRHSAVAIVGAYDFATAGTVVDIAGGQGVLIAAILRANPNLRGVLFDQPHVLADALPLLETAGVADRCELVSGDFFALGAIRRYLHATAHSPRLG